MLICNVANNQLRFSSYLFRNISFTYEAALNIFYLYNLYISILPNTICTVHILYTPLLDIIAHDMLEIFVRNDTKNNLESV